MNTMNMMNNVFPSCVSGDYEPEMMKELLIDGHRVMVTTSQTKLIYDRVQEQGSFGFHQILIHYFKGSNKLT